MRPRITYANVVSTLALLLVVSGGAYAAAQLPKESVRSKHIKNNTVKSKDLQDGTLTRADLKAGEIDAEVTGTPMGGDLAGTFPSPVLDPGLLADLATDVEVETGIADLRDDVVAGDRVDAALNLPGGGAPQALVGIPGVISVTARCSVAGGDRGLEINVSNDSPGTLAYTLRTQSVAPASNTLTSDSLLAGTDADYVFAPDGAGDNPRYLRLVVLNGRLLDLEVSAITNTLAAGCRVRGSAFLDGNGPV